MGVFTFIIYGSHNEYPRTWYTLCDRYESFPGIKEERKKEMLHLIALPLNVAFEISIHTNSTDCDNILMSILVHYYYI